MIKYKITHYGYVGVCSNKRGPLCELLIGKTHSGYYEYFYKSGWHVFPTKINDASKKELMRMALYIESKYPNWFGMAGD